MQNYTVDIKRTKNFKLLFFKVYLSFKINGMNKSKKTLLIVCIFCVVLINLINKYLADFTVYIAIPMSILLIYLILKADLLTKYKNKTDI